LDEPWRGLSEKAKMAGTEAPNEKVVVGLARFAAPDFDKSGIGAPAINPDD
jgi:hypothetical protein